MVGQPSSDYTIILDTTKFGGSQIGGSQIGGS
jgi:hypothetical protein